MLDLSLLGTGGMIPLPDRYLTAMLAKYNGHMLLIDCGEGTQVSMRALGWGFVSLDVILFTHLHADHIAGLPGLLLSLSAYGRAAPLTIVGPEGIEAVVSSLRIIAPELMYPIAFIELPSGGESQLVLGDFHVSALPLSHTLPCCGYSIHIPRAGKFDPERAKAQNIPLVHWSALKRGETVCGFTPDMVLGPPRRGIKVSYVTDSRPTNAIPDFIRGSDLFICEGIYSSDDKIEKAQQYGHMVFSEAAALAKAGDVKELWLTHYSQSLLEPEKEIDSAVRIFENTKAGRDHLCKTLLFED